MGIVYAITNRLNGRQYIGCVLRADKSMEDRFREHCRPNKNAPLLSKAITKYGPEAFSIGILAESVSYEEALCLERDFIQKLGTKAPSGYNLTDGGLGRRGGVPDSLETRCRKSRAHMGLRWSEATRQKMLPILQHRSPSTREKLSRNMKGNKQSMLGGLAKKGSKHSEATKQKIGQSLQGHGAGVPKSAEHRAKLSIAARNRKRGRNGQLL